MNISNMRTANTNTGKKNVFARTILALIAVFALAAQPFFEAKADTYDDQIKALEQEVERFQSEAGKLRAEADTLQNAINALNAEQAALEAQIKQKEVELDQLKQQIVDTEKRINNQRKALAKNLRSMYLESDISTLEMVASSRSIGDFIDKQEYRNKIRDSIQKSLVAIKELKTELEEKKASAEKVLADQKAMRVRLASQEAEKNKLLADTQGKEEAYQNLIGQKNNEIESLRAEQRAANLRWAGNVSIGPNCGGGYSGPWPEWCNSPLDAYVDQWGMYSRECVSYTAFKVWASGRHMPYWGGVGNANQWDENAAAAGIPVDGTPRVGDVAIWNSQPYGHAMYVEAVFDDGTIMISEYNLDWTGRYSERVTSAAGLVFIHF
jgi:peptidoglycan hydrolase CwlO-like protein